MPRAPPAVGSRGQPLPMTREDSPDSVPHADGHGGRGTGRPKDNGMGRTLTAPRRSSCWRRAGRSSSPRVLPARTRAVRGKATGDTHNYALQGQTCKLLRTPVRQVGEAWSGGESALKVARPRVLEPSPFALKAVGAVKPTFEGFACVLICAT